MMHAEERLLDLVGAMEDLKAMRNRVLREIELQEEKGKQRTQKVQAWLDKVVDMDQCTNQLVIDFSRCCVTGCCSLNIYSRLNVSRKATKLKKEIDELMKEKNHLSVLAKKRPSKPIIDMPISTTNVGIMTGSNLRVIRDYLGDKTFGIIGIYGMGGIGKTTLLKEIERSIYDWNMGFDYVIHAKASYELHVEDLRDCIAEQLSLCGPSRETIFQKNLAMDLEGKPFYRGSSKGGGQFMWWLATSSCNGWAGYVKQDINNRVEFHSRSTVEWALLKFM
ncbi:putative disease resistance protein At1g63350 [Dioscorea cayenensis subsp. rotundata]|uniref:Disease resistance protein At1g63350 n=1 Tax=Dioscorea cayennensis subsp. rotundata TaxID=55577 RepID=A0AB40AWF1_DIOCR|nr:putative disease resistance protein At1g63350 [Dioscorea cayenensis subsp. rotundata]